MMRKLLVRGFAFYMTIVFIFSILLLSLVIYWVVQQGWGALSWEFFTEPSRSFGEEGGVLYQLLGTILLALSSLIIALPLSLSIALYSTQYMKEKFVKAVDVLFYSLNGMPTIVFGLLGYIVFCNFLEFRVSWLSGAFILALMVLPTLVINIKESIESIPKNFLLMGQSLGLNKEQIIKAIVLPRCRQGIITGVLLAIGRAAGETAAIMFTATSINGDRFPSSFSEPTASLQTHILVLSQEAIDPVAKQNVWGTALILLMGILFINLISLYFRKKLIHRVS